MKPSISFLAVALAASVSSSDAYIVGIPTRTGQTTPVAYQWTLPDGQKQIFVRPRDLLYQNGRAVARVNRYPCVQTYAVGTVKRQRYAMCMPQIQTLNPQIYRRHLRDQIFRTLVPGPGYGMGYDDDFGFDDLGGFGGSPGFGSYPEMQIRRRRRMLRRRLMGRDLPDMRNDYGGFDNQYADFGIDEYDDY